MIVIGDFQFQNSINCIALNSKSINNPYALYKKCLFTIKNPRNLQYISNNEEYVLYGQRIVLKHISSTKLLQMNLDQPANEKGAFSV